MFFVKTNVTGPDYFLKGTTWTSAFERATAFETTEQAEAAKRRAAEFNPKAARKAVVIERSRG